MASLIDQIAGGEIPRIVKRAADVENVAPDHLAKEILSGKAVVPWNNHRELEKPCAIGRGLSTKVNANIGTSPDISDANAELAKLHAALDAGADTIMDLSIGSDPWDTRAALLEKCPVPLGTVPIYDAAINSGGADKLNAATMIDSVARHAHEGVDFMTIHCGVVKSIVDTLGSGRRICGVVSRGGSFMARWIARTGNENPFYERFDEIIDIAKEHEVTLSLGDGFRPGAIADSLDGPQIAELQILCDLAKQALAKGVQVMIEGPGHVPLHQVRAQVQLEKEMSGGIPFYVLGPIVTDIAPGYDHITGAIGGAIAAAEGADFLCYVTPAEHLGLPDIEHVRLGVVASRIAAHAGDIAKGIPGAMERDKKFSEMRRAQDWEGQLANCLDPKRAREIRDSRKPVEEDVCSMCGEYCVFRK